MDWRRLIQFAMLGGGDLEHYAILLVRVSIGLFFAISGLMKMFRFLNLGLALILMLMGIKLIAQDYYKIPTLAMLGAVAGVLAVSIVASVACPKSDPA